MTNKDRIKGHFSAIAECAGNLRRNYDPERAVENDEVTQYLRKQLDAIKELLEPEPETLGDSVLRLTDLCNRLEAENHRLKRALLLAGGNLTMLKKRNDKLETDLAGTEALLVIANRKLARKDQRLKRVEAELLRIKLSLEQNPTAAEERIRELERELARKDKHIDILRRDRRECEEKLAGKRRRLTQVSNQVVGLQQTLEGNS